MSSEHTVRAWRALAPAKINLGLYVGGLRGDGRHELVSVMQSISLADELVLSLDGGLQDEVVCPGVEAENLALEAVSAFRASTGWNALPVRLTIDKRVPVAAGLGGGSGDAAAALRLCARASGLGEETLLLDIAAGLGADVPAQVVPGCVLASGVGERLRRLPDPSDYGVLVLPLEPGLSTAEVYAEADRLGVARDPDDLAARLAALSGGGTIGGAFARELIVNDLEPAARALHPGIERALAEALAAGADLSIVSGSGPTVVGLFEGASGPERARAAAAAMDERRPPALAAEPVDAAFAEPAVVDLGHNSEMESPS